MARISYDESTADAYKGVREIPRVGLVEWRDAVLRHVRPAPGMTLLDIGAGTGQFAAAFTDWFDIDVIAVEPSDAMRARIPRSPRIRALDGDASALRLPDASADAAWLSLVIHHIADLAAAGREIRRVLRPGAPVLIRGGVSGPSYDGIELVRWFPETARTIDTFPSVEDVCNAFAGFELVTVEQVTDRYSGSLADFYAEIDTLRRADTTLRGLSEDEFLRGKERIRQAVESGRPDSRRNCLDLVVLR